jgi:hypothetical protein
MHGEPVILLTIVSDVLFVLSLMRLDANAYVCRSGPICALRLTEAATSGLQDQLSSRNLQKVTCTVTMD